MAGGRINIQKFAIIFSTVLFVFLFLGSVSAEDLNDTDNIAVPYDLEVSNVPQICPCDDILQDDVEETFLYGNNTELYYRNGTSFKVLLSDDEGYSLANQSIIFTINNVNYTRTTNGDGIASISINLESGNYRIYSVYMGNEYYDSSSIANDLNVLPTISGGDIVKYYRNDTQYYATFLDAQGDLLSDVEITFNINGVFYQRKTDGNGVAKLNINLLPGEYILTAINPINGDIHSNLIRVLSTISSDDLDMVHRDGHRFAAQILDDSGNPLVNTTVTFNINGVFYNRTTKDGGNAYLNINLDVGEYVITSTNYKGLSVSNKINIGKSNSIINAKDVYIVPGFDRNYDVTLYGSNGKAIAFAPIKFRYNGAYLTIGTDENGKASFPISKPSGGKYTIEYEFEGNLNYKPVKSSSTIFVTNSTAFVYGNDFNMVYKDGSKFEVTLIDSNLAPMAGETITFNVCGRSYDRSTDENGVAGLNINLIPGNYEVSYSYSNAGASNYCRGSNNIIVSKIPTYLSTNDLTFVYGSSRSFAAILTDGSKNPIIGESITFNIKGKDYSRTTDENGAAELPINLPVGYYKITASLQNDFYTADSRTNHVLVDGAIFTAYDITVYPGYSRDYTVTLLDAYEHPILNAVVEFTYAGITKRAATDDEGMATISVGGLSKGDYPIVYRYAERNTSGQSYIFVSENVLNTKNMISDLSLYLADSKNCQVSNSEIVALANRLTEGLTNPLDKAKAIFNYVRDTITYGYYYDTYYGAVGTLHSKTGNCVDQSHLTIALYRAAGLPARYVHGSCVFNSGTTYGHVWAQVLIGNTWIGGDTISSGNSLGKVVNWNNYNYKLHGYFPYIVF